MTRTPSLDAAYALHGPDDTLRLYADWAASYDRDFAAAMGYLLPLHVARAFAAADGSGPVLDLGAGTGLCGAALRGLGIGPVDATDLSQEMLDVAADKGLYARLFTGDLSDRLPVADGAYRGVVSAGTFTHGHVGPEALGEVLRVLAPDGVAALSVNAAHWAAHGFDAAFDALAGRITAPTRSEVPIYAAADGVHAGDTAFVLTFRRA